ncbi:MAG: hypothetical protein PHS44_05530 [Candidatus Dojkabacteria bacterium]|jgi:glutathione synthase/RimK-type ligase-like ATP-grasp enzyme|nr:hypothetical protein [Candidatus Dojkabacteria bacterium]
MKRRKKKVLVLPAPDGLKEIRRMYDGEVDIVRGAFKNIQFRFNHHLSITHKGIDLKDFDFVWVSSLLSTRDMSRSISLYLEHHDVPHTAVNDGEGASKLIDLTHFYLKGLPTPDTFFQQRQNLSSSSVNIESICRFPLVVKDIKGSRGKNSYLVSSKEELMELIDTLPKNRNFVFQEFIPNYYDWGILVAKGEVVSAEKSFPASGEFRNNACHGAREVFVDVDEVDQRLKNIAIKSCEVLNLEWGRADIVIEKDTNDPHLLEVNRFPGITLDSSEVTAFSGYLRKRLENESII